MLAEHDDLSEAFFTLIETIASQVERPGFKAGGPLTAIAMETAASNPTLNQACQAAFSQIQKSIEDKLSVGGIEESKISSIATFIISAIEGGTLLSRTQHSGESLRKVAKHIKEFLNSQVSL